MTSCYIRCAGVIPRRPASGNSPVMPLPNRDNLGARRGVPSGKFTTVRLDDLDVDNAVAGAPAQVSDGSTISDARTTCELAASRHRGARVKARGGKGLSGSSRMAMVRTGDRIRNQPSTTKASHQNGKNQAPFLKISATQRPRCVDSTKKPGLLSSVLMWCFGCRELEVGTSQELEPGRGPAFF